MAASERTLKVQRTYHLVMIAFWIAMILPSTIWWKESILLVIFMSIYANAEASFSAYHGVSGQLEQRRQNGNQHCCCCSRSDCSSD